MRIVSIATLLLSVALLAGCNSTPVKTAQTSQSSAADSTTGTTAVPTNTMSTAQQLSVEQLARQELAKTGFVIYFDYDKSDIKPESAAIITAHAKYLANTANLKVRLEGNTDERGSREYNIGLGERRAQAVRRALMLQGVAETQITTLSYGAERPAVDGHDEAAYAKNRRVELSY